LILSYVYVSKFHLVTVPKLSCACIAPASLPRRQQPLAYHTTIAIVMEHFQNKVITLMQLFYFSYSTDVYGNNPRLSATPFTPSTVGPLQTRQF
jgi:hypothetical protein